MDAAQLRWLQLRQFAAVLHKNLLLQTRSRQSILGIGGWGALLLQLLTPVAFFSLMCIPKYYIKPYVHPMYLETQEYQVDTKWWAGASPYEGPAYDRNGSALVFLSPDTPGVRQLVTRLAKALSCPDQPYKRICSQASITTFACLWGVQGAPAACLNQATCLDTPACWQPALDTHLAVFPDHEAAWEAVQERAGEVDAWVVLEEPQCVQGPLHRQQGRQQQQQWRHTQEQPHRRQQQDQRQKEAGRVVQRSSWPHGISNSSRSRSAVNSSSKAGGAAAPNLLPLAYTIRMNHSDVPPPGLKLDMFDVSPGTMPLPGNLLWEYRAYWFFLNLQLSLDRSILGALLGNGSHPMPLDISIKPFPWPSRKEDLGAASAAAFLNLLLVYAFLAPTRAVVGSIVREKELRLKEGMRILGLSDVAYWCSWALTHWVTLATSGLLCALVGWYPFRHSSLALMATFYCLFSAALISYSYWLSTWFSSSRVAGTATQFVYALSMLPGFILPFTRPYGGPSWYWACLSPPSAASLFAAALVNWERLAAGVTGHTLWLPVTQGGTFSVGVVYVMLAVDVVVFMGAAWYCDKVIPSTHGQRLPFWFPLLPSYWRSNQPTTAGAASSTHPSSSSPELYHAAASPGAAVNGSTSAVQSNPGSAVVISKLTKVFALPSGGRRCAVDKLSLTMQQGQVTALLGHNGAGKTTTIHMLTGMLQPTSGTAYINRQDIRTHMASIRRSLGICPQFDILWPDLTVGEHLLLYAAIKGAQGRAATYMAGKAADEVGLLPQWHSMAGELSGGQRRKLSVAIAFLGRPEVVVLDEPTSGMDPASRRATWQVIRSRRATSCILLTTHSMEEADLLADYVFILAEGRLAAQGTPLDLKTRYGVGYTLTAVLDRGMLQQAAASPQGQLLLGAAANQQQAAELQRKLVGAGLVKAAGSTSPGRTGSSTRLEAAAGGSPAATPVQLSSQNLRQQQQQEGGEVGGGDSRPSPSLSTAARLGGGSPTAGGGMSRSTSASSLRAATHAVVSSAAQQLLGLVAEHVAGAELVSAGAGQVAVRLPQDNRAAFPQLLRDLEASRCRLGITSWGLSVTTLEEVFLTVEAAATSGGGAATSSATPAGGGNTAGGGRATSSATPAGAQETSPSKAAGGGEGGPAAAAATEAGPPAAAAAPGVRHQHARSATSDALLDIWEGEEEAEGGGSDGLLTGWRLYGQQLKALLLKRALCARRDRLALLTQLLVPLLLVYLSLWCSSLTVTSRAQEALQMSRPNSLLGQPVVVAAAPALRQQPEYQGLLDAFPREDLSESVYTQLFRGPSGPPLNLTLEGQLLSNWAKGHPAYDALYVRHLPPLEDLLTGQLPGPQLTLLTNQSAISGLPASANQVTSALLRLLLAAGAAGRSYCDPCTGVTGADTWVSERLQALEGPNIWDHQQQGQRRLFGKQNKAHEQLSSRLGSSHRLQLQQGPQHSEQQQQQQPQPRHQEDSVEQDLPHHQGPLQRGTLPSCLPSLAVTSSPLPVLPSESLARVRQDAASLMLVLCLTMAASVLTASFAVYLVREQDNASKHLQMVSGAGVTAYWLANYAWDLAAYSLPAAAILGLVAAYRLPQLSGPRLGALAGLLWGLGAAGISATYLLHFLFVDEMKALQRLNTLYFLVGYLGFVATWVLDLVASIMHPPHLAEFSAGLQAGLRWVSPHFCFARGVYDVQNTYQAGGALPFPLPGPQPPTNPFAYSIWGSALVHLGLQAAMCGLATLLVDWGVSQQLQGQLQHLSKRLQHWWSAQFERPGQQTGYQALPSRPPAAEATQAAAAGHEGREVQGGRQHKGQGVGRDGRVVVVEDVDVQQERREVQAGRGWQDAKVLLDGLFKAYHLGGGLAPVQAVGGVWLRLQPGECFGLLGVNGAGKTTTFKMLTGQLLPDKGEAWVAGQSVVLHRQAARQHMGYCPQFEALPGQMTGREVLTMYARLRGAPERSIPGMVRHLVNKLGLVKHADVLVGNYSGGVKRKLSVAVALVGDPPVVLLDEPSTGMDPAARRALWQVIQEEVMQAGRTVLLTSHSMEECDVLCDRLAIMVAGRLACLGSPQHLKGRFGDGYTLEVRLQVEAAAQAHPASQPEPAPEQQQQQEEQVGAVVAQAAPADSHGSPGPQQQREGAPAAAPAAAAAAAWPGGIPAAQLEGVCEELLQHLQQQLPGTQLLEREPGRLLLRLPILDAAAAAAAPAGGSITPATQASSSTSAAAGGGGAPGEQRAVSSSSSLRGETGGSIGAGGFSGGAPGEQLAAVFEVVEAARAPFAISDYSVAQSSLERVFLLMAPHSGQQ